MTPAIRALFLALIVLVVGLVAVYLEVEQVRAGERLRLLLSEEQARRENLRRLEARFVTACSPDLLLQEVKVADRKREKEEKVEP